METALPSHREVAYERGSKNQEPILPMPKHVLDVVAEDQREVQVFHQVEYTGMKKEGGQRCQAAISQRLGRNEAIRVPRRLM